MEEKVYLMRRDGLYKIGRSKDPEERARKLRGRRGSPIEVIHTISTGQWKACRIESRLQLRFADKCVGQEWFRLDEEDVRLICSITECEDEWELPDELLPKRRSLCNVSAHLPEDVYEEVCRRAKAGGRALWQEVLLAVERHLAAPPEPAGVFPKTAARVPRKPRPFGSAEPNYRLR